VARHADAGVHGLTEGFLSQHDRVGWAVLSGPSSKGPSESSSIRPTGLVTWAALRGGWGVSPFGGAKLQRLLTGQEKSQCGPGRARIVFTPDRIRNLGRPEVTLCSLDSLGVRVRELRQGLTAESRSGMGTPTHPASTPYWTTFELPAIDMKAASVGILDQMVAGLR